MQPRPDDRGEPYNLTVTPVGVWALQCSHGLMTVENRRVRGVRAGAEGASMQPRPDDRGERRWASTWAEGRAALQCSHGLMTVENARACASCPASSAALQCSHGLMTVENASRDKRAGSPRVCFNA